MSKIIEITVKEKIAETDFCEVVSLNNNYRLRFHFDEEWNDYIDRVAVVRWEHGSSEQLFQGEECDMPMVDSVTSEVVQVGVYSILNGKRISSSLVTLRCMAGACAKPGAKRVDSLHEQILDYLNQHEGVGGGKIEGSLYVGKKSYNGSEDVTITGEDLGLARVALSGSYRDLTDQPAAVEAPVKSVNGKTGDVVISKNELGLARVALSGDWNDLNNKPEAIVTEVNGKTGKVTISKNELGLAKVAISGDWEDLSNKPEGFVTEVNGKTGKVTISKNELGLAKVALTGNWEDLSNKPEGFVTEVNGKTGKVTISKNELGLAKVAISGDWEDLSNKPEGFVTEVNGKTGKVVISKNELGLAKVALSGSYNDLGDKPAVLTLSDQIRDGVDANKLTDSGLYHVRGTASAVMSNAPTSTDNTLSNGRWCIWVINQKEDNLIVQIAISEKADRALRIRNCTNGTWNSWNTIA